MLALMVPAMAVDRVVVGAKNFTEQLVMAELTAQLLRSRGIETRKRTGFATSALRRGQEAGELDVVWEYTGTALTTFHRIDDKLDAEETYARVKSLDAERGLVWLTPSRVNNTYALAIRRADAERTGVRSLSDLAAQVRAGHLNKLGCNSEFFFRSDGLAPLERNYGFAFDRTRVIRIDTSLVYHALRDEQIDVGLVFATDGRVKAYDFALLADDKSFFPVYAMTPVVRREVLEGRPELVGILNSLAARLDNATMSRLNAAVDLGRRPVDEVAASFLKDEGLR